MSYREAWERCLTIGQLKEKLDALLASGVSADTKVTTEGCDCTGYACDVVVVDAECVEITRVG